MIKNKFQKGDLVRWKHGTDVGVVIVVMVVVAVVVVVVGAVAVVVDGC